jgi:hypothetical protein
MDVAFGMIIILVAVCIRIPVASSTMYGTNLNKREMLFVGIAWMPKATVQAALGGAVLNLA